MGNGNPDIEPLKMGYNFVRFKRAGDKYVFEGDLNYADLDKLARWYDEAEKEYAQYKEDYLTQKLSQ
jgi:hypothetical protein